MTPIFSKQHGSSRILIDHNSPINQSSHESSDGKRKMRILKYIYDDLDVCLNFTLFSFQTSSSEDTIKD